ncbi:SusC/RagA family TonB-linked outer membrane protein [Confluentibacter flavum]|uniref:SusC/RagA family TonB-linked outer membrane protein n=2 Tax=Confluentibacter flavum TaxID=1909700 RepID=A0A2N3HII5_9FLAO|nr:TonB-dependent receptor [Confluentibacter flavum]PKQ44628.1 SusC/RagA family TonB-linked outer membrane protein [Confluentibacter flavum]
MEISLTNPAFPFRKQLLMNIMRIMVFFFCTAFFALSPNDIVSQNSKVKIAEDKLLTVNEVFYLIMEQTDYKFFYEKGIFEDFPKVQVKKGVIRTNELLKRSLSHGNLEITLNANNAIIIKEIPPKTLEEKVQEYNVSGTVKDQSGQPLSGANILEKGTGNGVMTDFDGNFSIEVANSNAILVVSFMGFANKEIPVNGQSNINVTLEEIAAGLDEVVVVGYGTQKKTHVTGSIATVKMDDVVNVPTANVKSLLIGQIPGLITNQNPGLPGEDNVQLNIRGFASPLVIVDGIESYIDRLDPNDVESITVLKDASAAIYGARGGNGVILVTTKRGKQGKTKINYHGWYGTQHEIALPEFANAADYLQIQRDAFFNTQYDPTTPNKPIDYGVATEELISQYRSGELTSYDWKNRLVKNGGAQIANHNFSVSGGSENLTHYTSIGVMNQNGILRGDYDYGKITITHNMDAKITKDLHMALNASYIDEVTDYASGGVANILNDLRTSQPFYAYELPDPDRVPFSGFSQRSIIGRMFKKFAGYDLKKTQTLAAAMDLKYDASFLPGLTLGSKVNVRFRNRYTEILNRPYEVYTYNPELVSSTDDGYRIEGVQSGNVFSKSYTGGGDSNRRIVSRFYGQFNKTYDKHEIGLLAFFEHENNQYDGLSASRLDNLSPDVPQIVGENKLTTTDGYAKQLEYTRISYTSRLNYNYDNKYLLEATFRADASSKFGPKNRWGYFPSVSAGWNVHKENFMENNNTINQLKLRLSYSESGIDSNVSNTSFDYLTGFQETGNIYILDGMNIPIISNAGLINELISWEKVTMYNAGLDFSLLKSKVYGEVDIFYRERTGLLGRDIGNTSSIFGASLPLININSRNNRGWELALGYRDNIGDFRFDIKGNVGFSREKYDYQVENIDFDNPRNVKYNQLSGNWTNRVFGYITDGLFNSQAEVDEYLAAYTIEDIPGTPKPGDIRYIDVNGDNIINLDDRELIGRGATPNLTYALQTIISYKNWSLVTQWQGASLFNINVGGHVRAPFFTNQVPLAFHTKYAWVQDPSNPGVSSNPNAQIPAFEISGTRSWNNPSSDFWLKDGTYVRLKSATVAYSLPKEVLNKIGVSNLELYVSGDNLLTLSKLGIYKEDHDPEQLSDASGFGLPLMRTFSLGIKLGL